MTHLWTPPLFCSARECLLPILENPKAWNWASQIFDPKRTPIDTSHFSMAFQHQRRTEDDLMATHNVFLPIHIDTDAGFACCLNRGKSALHTDKNGADMSCNILSRTSVATFKTSNIGFDITHFEDDTASFTASFGDEYGSVHSYTFRFQKTKDGLVDIDRPLKALYEIGSPHCQFCDYRGIPCKCSEWFLDRAKVRSVMKPCHSFLNFMTMFGQRKARMTKVYIADPDGQICFLQVKKPTPRIVTRVSAWDYLGPNFLAGLIPLEANLILDSYNPLNSKPTVEVPDLLDTDFFQDDADIPQMGNKAYIEEIDQQQLHENVNKRIIDDSTDITQPIDTGHKSASQSESFRHHTYLALSENLDMSHVNVLSIEQPNFEVAATANFTVPIIDSSFTTKKCSMGPNQGDISKGDPSKSYECSYCGKLLSSKGNMFKHVRSVHEKEKKKLCKLCGTKFHQKSNLLRHLKKVHRLDNSQTVQLMNRDGL